MIVDITFYHFFITLESVSEKFRHLKIYYYRILNSKIKSSGSHGHDSHSPWPHLVR